MSMIQNYQEEQALQKPQPEAARLAEVLNVWSNGLEVLFEGDVESDHKRYKCAQGIYFQPRDRVLVQKVSGSYIVVCKVGDPLNELYGFYKGPVSWEMKDADGTLSSATSRINRIIDLLQYFGIAY